MENRHQQYQLVAETPTIHVGTYQIGFTANGYGPQMQDRQVIKGKTAEINLALVIAD